MYLDNADANNAHTAGPDLFLDKIYAEMKKLKGNKAVATESKASVYLKVDSWTNPQNAPTLFQRSDKDVGVTHYDPWVRVVVAANVNPVTSGGRAASPTVSTQFWVISLHDLRA